MSSKKQRRRELKTRRHEYEWVTQDEEGREVVVDPAELKSERPAKQAAAKGGGARTGRADRKVPPPSWERVLKRMAIFAPLMIIVIALLNKGHSVASWLVPSVIMLIVFLPFSYMVDSAMYKAYLKRTGQQPPEKPTAGR